MKLSKKVYETRAEKQKDFIIGIGIFFCLNVLLAVLLGIGDAILSVPLGNSTSEVISSLALLASCLFTVLPFVINIAVLIYFFLTRTWIAIGMLGAFGVLLILALIVGVVMSVVCFGIMGSEL